MEKESLFDLYEESLIDLYKESPVDLHNKARLFLKNPYIPIKPKQTKLSPYYPETITKNARQFSTVFKEYPSIITERFWNIPIIDYLFRQRDSFIKEVLEELGFGTLKCSLHHLADFLWLVNYYEYRPPFNFMLIEYICGLSYEDLLKLITKDDNFDYNKVFYYPQMLFLALTGTFYDIGNKNIEFELKVLDGFEDDSYHRKDFYAKNMSSGALIKCKIYLTKWLPKGNYTTTPVEDSLDTDDGWYSPLVEIIKKYQIYFREDLIPMFDMLVRGVDQIVADYLYDNSEELAHEIGMVIPPKIENIFMRTQYFFDNISKYHDGTDLLDDSPAGGWPEDQKDLQELKLSLSSDNDKFDKFDRLVSVLDEVRDDVLMKHYEVKGWENRTDLLENIKGNIRLELIIGS